LRQNRLYGVGGFVVKKMRFSVEHIAGILKSGDLGTPVSELCRQHGIAEQSFYRWKKLDGNMEPSEARELRQLPRGEHEVQALDSGPVAR
jgi:putative transposase